MSGAKPYYQGGREGSDLFLLLTVSKPDLGKFTVKCKEKPTNFFNCTVVTVTLERS